MSVAIIPDYITSPTRVYIQVGSSPKLYATLYNNDHELMIVSEDETRRWNHLYHLFNSYKAHHATEEDRRRMDRFMRHADQRCEQFILDSVFLRDCDLTLSELMDAEDRTEEQEVTFVSKPMDFDNTIENNYSGPPPTATAVATAKCVVPPPPCSNDYEAEDEDDESEYEEEEEEEDDDEEFDEEFDEESEEEDEESEDEDEELEDEDEAYEPFVHPSLVKGAVAGLVTLSKSAPKEPLDLDMVNYRLEQLERRLQELIDRFPN
jgi:hypothetical protein